MEEPIILAINNHVATVTINREKRRNALDHITLDKLDAAFDTCAQQDVTVIILRGSGTKAFCAGDDIKAYATRTKKENQLHHAKGLRLMEKIEEHPCLVIAAIEGFCLGGGMELAISCDYRICGSGSVFGLPEVRNLGLLPSWGGLTRLPKIVGLSHTKALVLMGNRLTSDQALTLGLINEVVDDGKAYEHTLDLATDYASEVNQSAVGLAKRVMLNAYGAPDTTARLLNELADQIQSSGEILTN
tara:strand:+ start:1024 stop:1758 length:735 start_codon:yes stop_codon:yes gene_type:complete